MDRVWGFQAFPYGLSKSMEIVCPEACGEDTEQGLLCIIYSLFAINNIFTAYKSLFWKYFLT